MSDSNKEAYADGVKYAKDKCLKLLQEVLDAYSSIQNDFDDLHKDERDKLKGQLKQAINAVSFCISWVDSGGTEDEDGNRVCLPW
jgi:hypothetical protein